MPQRRFRSGYLFRAQLFRELTQQRRDLRARLGHLHELRLLLRERRHQRVLIRLQLAQRSRAMHHHRRFLACARLQLRAEGLRFFRECGLVIDDRAEVLHRIGRVRDRTRVERLEASTGRTTDERSDRELVDLTADRFVARGDLRAPLLTDEQL